MANEFGEFLDNENSAIRDESTLMKKVFVWMTIGILVTAITSLITVSVENIMEIILSNIAVVLGLVIAELVLVAVLSSRASRLSFPVAVGMFLLYSAINGLTLSVIFLAYELSSIVNIFFMSSGIFALMALIGATTSIDLSKIGNILLIGLLGIIIGSIINLFLLNDTLGILLCAIGAVLFIVITAYDVQKIKILSQNVDEENFKALPIICALTLYLDFINLFLKLLRLFGKRRR